MIDRHPEEMSERELEIKSEEFALWMGHPVTREFRRRLIVLFDHQAALLATKPGDTADSLRGRAEVLQYVLKPVELFEE